MYMHYIAWRRRVIAGSSVSIGLYQHSCNFGQIYVHTHEHVEHTGERRVSFYDMLLAHLDILGSDQITENKFYLEI